MQRLDVMRWVAVLGLIVGLAGPLHAEPDGESEDATTAAKASAGDSGTAGDAGTAGAAAKKGGDEPADEQTVAEELIAKIAQAREIGVILLILSVLGVGFTIERLVNLRRSTICPEGLAMRVLEHLRHGDHEQVEAECRKQPSIMADILSSINRHHTFSFADLNLIASDIAAREVEEHIQRCYPIAIVATVAPLLGLLGTVIGMIGAFEKVALMGEMGDASVMASEISYALVTTAMGLVIAAPALALYRIFRMRTTKLTARMDEQVSELISGWQEFRQQQGEAKSVESAPGSTATATPAKSQAKPTTAPAASEAGDKPDAQKEAGR